MAWYRGLKTTYYLRALAATSTEKSTINTGKLNAVSSGGDSAPVQAAAPAGPAPVPKACAIDEPDCEACQ
jgi:ribonucleoside-diphosphate reductase alpha chain